MWISMRVDLMMIRFMSSGPVAHEGHQAQQRVSISWSRFRKPGKGSTGHVNPRQLTQRAFEETR